MIGGLDERRSTFSQSSQIETGYKLRFGGGFVRSAARIDQRSTGRFHLRDFDDFSLDVVGRRFADLFGILKTSGTHFGAAFSEPLPISRKFAVLHVAFGLMLSSL